MRSTATNSFEQTHYEVLGVSQDANPDDIKRSFHRLARMTHPDKRRQKNSGIEYEDDSSFVRIKEAWKILSNELLRKNYDDELSRRSFRSRSAHDLSMKILLSDMKCELCQVYDDESSHNDSIHSKEFTEQRVYLSTCPCGDIFEIFSDDLIGEETGRSGEELYPHFIFDCCSCSHRICVVKNIS